MTRLAFAICVLTLTAIVVAQSAAHLSLALREDRIGTIFDLDRSNGIPDVVSTLMLAIGAGGAAVLAIAESRGARRNIATAIAALLAALALADLLHDGAHPTRSGGTIVVALAIGTVVLIAFLAHRAALRGRVTLVVGVCCLAASFLVAGLDRVDHWFERRRPDPVAELQIVAKEGLELLGWGLVAIALWDVALGRRTARERPTALAEATDRSPSVSAGLSAPVQPRRPRVG